MNRRSHSRLHLIPKENIKVLLIDDDTEFVMALAERMELRGFGVKVAGDGETGISMILEESFDVIILDLMMTGLSGMDTLKQIKMIDKTLPVLLLTGYGATKQGIEGMRTGASDYLVKPVGINTLIEAVCHAVQTGAPDAAKF